MSNETPPGNLATEFCHFIGGLCDVVARHLERDASAIALLATIVARLCRCQDRLLAVLARFKAGTLLAPCRARAMRPHSGAPRAPDPVPRCRAYLGRLLQYDGAVYGRILEILLADPEMAALLSASPQAGRLLRPLWRMLSPRRYPPMLQPPPRGAAPSSASAPPTRPAPFPEAPWVSPGLPDVRRDPETGVRRPGFGPPIPA